MIKFHDCTFFSLQRMTGKPNIENSPNNNTHLKLTYDTFAGHHTGNPFLPHCQSATQPANKYNTKHHWKLLYYSSLLRGPSYSPCGDWTAVERF